MTRAYSLDLRERAMARVEAGESIRQVGSALCVAPSTVSKWSTLKRETGSLVPAPQGGARRPPVLGEADRTYILARLADESHATLRGLKDELAERGTRASYGAIWDFVHSAGLSFKKNRNRGRTLA